MGGKVMAQLCLADRILWHGWPVSFHQFAQRVQPAVIESELESRRFGMRVGRLSYGFGLEPTAAEVAELVEASRCDLVILRFDATATKLSGDLCEALPDHDLIFGDTLLYYSSVGQRLMTANRAPLVDLGPDMGDLHECIRSVFAEYSNHYAANPLTRGVAMASVYEEWTRSLEQGATLMTIGIAAADGSLDGCLIAQRQPVGPDVPNVWEVVLAGIVPRMRGAGLYGRLVRGFNARIRQLESDWVISTQAWNLPAQRAWVRAGLRPESSLVTLHIQRRAVEGFGGH